MYSTKEGLQYMGHLQGRYDITRHAGWGVLFTFEVMNVAWHWGAIEDFKGGLECLRIYYQVQRVIQNDQFSTNIGIQEVEQEIKKNVYYCFCSQNYMKV